MEKEQEEQAENKQIDSEVLRNSAAFINSPPAIFEGVVVAKEFDKEAANTIENKHQGKDGTGSGEELSA